jgi:hypothetical protein
MIRRIPTVDLSRGEEYILEGEENDRLSDDRTVTIDPRTGREFESGTPLRDLPNNEIVQVPRTHWGNL